ncbi:conserved repeat domain-containing protein/gliding motility-associated C-terminal domain-containing protein [Algoriphagus locisalis]|uniref:Conserved repeat domain-containing protein/gliding motility-associated C-terminal domain-containing protein n=1 Tax=Algoriphagus locisalis TaxID=305507 RepID=A0A1I7BYL6_9BACT|nr:BspA family leucine-rich repeat surface protein [Algoriphagus locisalis]SFT92261.1 conserved repeat domain-containing protein/gliding motility-associated C-terminal domain-containing protein [Algoriphagus locisalis]
MKLTPFLIFSFKFLVLMIIINIGFSFLNQAFAQEKPFVFKWNVHEGDYPQVGFSVYGTGLTIDWGNGKSLTIPDANEGMGVSNFYDNPGEYTISISGSLTRVSLESYLNPGQPYHLEEIVQWGGVEWNSMEDMFNGTDVQFGISSIDKPDLSQVTSLARMFRNARFDENLGDWDIRMITDMSEIFSGSTLSPQNYDATLIGWASQNVQRNVVVGAEGLVFCEGKVARQKLIDEYGWTFVGDVEFCEHLTQRPFIFSVSPDINEGNFSFTLQGTDVLMKVIESTSLGDIKSTYYKFLPEGGLYRIETFNQVTIEVYGGLTSADLKLWPNIGIVQQWGDIKWKNLDSFGFELNISTHDLPDLSGVSSLYYTLAGSYSVPFNLEEWDVSTISVMNGTFGGAPLNVDLGSWDIRNIIDMARIFDGSSLSQENYDKTLIGWASQDVKRNVMVGAEGLTFCEGKAARQKLIDEYGWTFVGDALAEECQVDDPDAFVTIWGATNKEIYIPTADPNYSYNYTIDWGDGTIEEGLTGRGFHRYDNTGPYKISITGQFPKLWINGIASNPSKIISVEQWGAIQWKDGSKAFEEGEFMDINATDAPDLSQAFTLNEMFYKTGITTPDLNNWDVSTIENFEQMFSNARLFNGKIDQWNMRSALSLAHMFYEADKFNQDISGWDMSSVVNISYMFAEADLFNQPIGSWEFNNLQNLNKTFENAVSFDQSLANWDISSVISMEGIFDGSGLSQENYDATLIGWASQNVQRNVVVGAEGLTFCAGKAARQKLIDDYLWRFEGDAEATDCKELITGITFEDATFTYDGTLKTITIIGELPDGVTVTYENNTGTEVGSQTATAYLDGGENYEDLTLTATLTIEEGEAPTATASDIQVENREVCAGEIVLLEAISTSVTNPVFTFYLDADLTQKIESSEIEVFQDTQVFVTVKGDGVNENLPEEAVIIDIKVNLVEAPVFLVSSQEFCSENMPTLDDLVVEPITSGATMEYYASLESNEPLAWNTPLENKTYYAEVYDGVNGCGSARVPITAVLKTCEQEPGEKLPIDGITFADATFIYDGTEKSIQISGNLPTGVTVTYENNTRTEIGSQTATAKLDGGESYENLTLIATLTIVEGEVPTATASDIQVTELEVCLGEVLDLTASSTTVTSPIFTFYLDEQLTQKIEDDKIQILGDTQIFVTVKGSGINENIPGEAAVWQIAVRTVEPPVFLMVTQEFCVEDKATLAQIVVQGIGEEEQLNYYSSEDASEPLAMSALLESKTYFAEKVDLLSGCSSVRIPVVVEVNTCPQESINFSISKTADVSTVLPGGQITYTITIQNDSDQSTGQLNVSDQLNEFLTFISASHNGQLNGENEVTWTVDNLEAGASIQLNLLVEVSLDVPVDQVISNVAEGKLVDDPEQVKPSNTVEVLVDGVAQTAVSIQKNQSVNGEISPGESIEYQITVTNTGESPAFDLVIEDVFPQELVLTNASTGAEVENSKVTWYLEELAAGQSVSFTLSFDVLGEQGSLINFASASGENFPAVSDQTDPVTIKEIPSPDLMIYLESAPEMVLKGKEYQIKIQVVNTGSVGSGPLAVDHYFSDLVGYVRVSSEVGDISYDSSNKYLIWTIDEISPGDTLELILELKANEEGLVENFFQVYSDTPDPDYSNNELVFTINQSELRIPNVFTPNGDGINESWRIEQLNELFASNQLVVFDRMGKTVFSTDNYQNDWSGTGLTRGTYFYELTTIDFEGNSYQFSGFVTLIY